MCSLAVAMGEVGGVARQASPEAPEDGVGFEFWRDRLMDGFEVFAGRLCVVLLLL